MSILSQTGIIAVIILSCILMFRMDKMLVKASEEEEHFVDDWEIMQKKKTEIALEKEKKKQEQAFKFEEEKKRIEAEKQRLKAEKERLEAEQAEAKKQKAEAKKQQAEAKKQQAEAKKQQEEAKNGRSRSTVRKTEEADVIFMDRYKRPGITLALQDDRHRTLRRVNVSELPFTIGRSRDNMLVLDDLCVARKHCRIVEKDGAFVLEDLGTSNQLFADGSVTDQVVLTDQSVVYIGNVELRVEMDPGRSINTQIYREPRRNVL